MLEKSNLIDQHGNQLDAQFSIERSGVGFDLYFESRGGAKGGPTESRNSDYNPGLNLLLHRAGSLGITLDAVSVASSRAMKLPDSARLVFLDKFTLPLALNAISDKDMLRRSIGRALASFQSRDGRGTHYTKRVQLHLKCAFNRPYTLESLKLELAGTAASSAASGPAPSLSGVPLRPPALITPVPMKDGASAPTEPPDGRQTPARAIALSARYGRLPGVSGWVLSNAVGICEVCKKPAPFTDFNGEPFLEVHHLMPLSRGGPDTVDNAIACCPNCHRMLHYGADAKHERDRLMGSISRLNDYEVDA